MSLVLFRRELELIVINNTLLIALNFIFFLMRSTNFNCLMKSFGILRLIRNYYDYSDDSTLLLTNLCIEESYLWLVPGNQTFTSSIVSF